MLQIQMRGKLNKKFDDYNKNLISMQDKRPNQASNNHLSFKLSIDQVHGFLEQRDIHIPVR